MSRGSEKRARNRPITIRLTADERAKIEQDAARAGLTTGSYARRVLLGADSPRQIRRPPIERVLLAKMLGQVGSAGNNLNQIARALNRGRDLYDGALIEALGQLREIRDALLEALGRGS
ncbi:MAG: plasmid mobilization relaxosome protein MobC [Novosphingobium sp.]|nr:plasmid mobilization relaxosome protein MobC [Novosphingobium sp.]